MTLKQITKKAKILCSISYIFSLTYTVKRAPITRLVLFAMHPYKPFIAKTISLQKIDNKNGFRLIREAMHL